MFTFSEIPQFEELQKVVKIKRLSVYLVGGYLRDCLLKRQSRDYDFAVSRKALDLALVFAKKIRGAYVVLDEERGCARVVKKIRKEIYTYDFADYREETLLKDLKHRDFTINTLCVDIVKVSSTDSVVESIKDYKKGLKDFSNKMIRMVSASVFKEDPLRILRALSFKASLKYKIEPKTLNQMKKDVDLIRNVSFERISVEFFKILETERASTIIRQMDQMNLLDKIIPQVAGMYKCQQGPYHHLDVWKHSLETVKQLERILKEFRQDPDVGAYLDESIGGTRSRGALIKLAALLHDVGKPDTRKIEQGKYSFHAHEHVGKRIVKYVAKMLKLSTRERYALQDMVQFHLRPGYLSNYKRPTDKAVYRFFRDAKDEAISVLLLSLADQRSTRGPLTTEKDQAHHENICRKLIDKFVVKQKEKPPVKFLNGHDIMKRYRLKPGSFIGEILQEVDEQQALGKVSNITEAWEAARKYYEKKNKKL